MADDREDYENIRDIPYIKALFNKRLVDVTENDDGEPACLYLMFEEGTVIEISITEDRGLWISPGGE